MKTVMTSLLMVLMSFMASPVSADSQPYVCDSANKANLPFPVLETECPIGEGLWGNSEPTANDKSFWIQCGFVQSGSLRDVPNQLQQNVSKSIWLKPELNGDRCLIGPYDTFQSASNDLAEVKALPQYEDAFIRTTHVFLTTSETQLVASADKQVSEGYRAAATATPFMIAGQHGLDECLC
ncbi:hypothetical protein VTH8203_03686 [Vibrio thalassae]|uniref:SPOR domain-containing protein n=1 Tax=Vibrio thalassae TaxID=1243014 RepID=A0A240EN01_9VIBR|nr:SPOR domain-containing protein [Vibrio thalassae]SNX50038.1 hypothetical protein VTH8203_03686 [Vibrio thalassae]